MPNPAFALKPKMRAASDSLPPEAYNTITPAASMSLAPQSMPPTPTRRTRHSCCDPKVPLLRRLHPTGAPGWGQSLTRAKTRNVFGHDYRAMSQFGDCLHEVVVCE